MAKIDKKREKLEERILMLEAELRLSLTQKTSSTKEINLAEYHRKRQELITELKNLK